MSVITSKDSRTFKELQRLTQKKYRDREGLFIAENPKVVGEALSQDGIDVLRVIAREGSGYESFTDGTVTLSAELFDRVSDTMTSQGVLAVVKKPDRGDIKALLAKDPSKPGSDTIATEPGNDIIVLDRLQDPGNIGTIIRTAEGAGISAAVFIKGTCDPFSPKVVRACAGSIFRMPIIFCDSTEEFISIAKECGYRLAVTDVDRGVPYYEAGLSRAASSIGHSPNGDRHQLENDAELDAPIGACPRLENRLEERHPIALVIGNEGNGVSDTFRDAADILVNIPMHGKLESLNASVAAALLMYEMGRPE